MFAAIKFGDVIVIATMVVTEIETVIVTGVVTWIATPMGRPFQLRLHLGVIGSNSDYTFGSLVPTPITPLSHWFQLRLKPWVASCCLVVTRSQHGCPVTVL
jgi:hypothetical protein